MYTLIEKPERIYAVDDQDVEIIGARRPYGHKSWSLYPTVRLGDSLPHVFALTREAARAWVELVADLYVQGERS